MKKHSETQLKENEEFFHLLVETKDYACIMLSASGEILSWNLGAKCISGFSSQEIFGKHISFCYPGDDCKRKLAEEQLNEVIEKGRTETESWLRKKDGSCFFANIIFTALFNDTGQLRGIAAMFRDITVQRQLEIENRALRTELEERVRQRTYELEVANKELEAFSYSVSHDLRAPLRALSGYAEMLREDYGDKLDLEALRIMNIISDNARIMGQLIDDLLAFSKLSRLEVSDQLVDMKGIVRKSVAELLHLHTKNTYSISVDDLPPCFADHNMLKQVWVNLIDNALKYSSKSAHPQIQIGATIEGDFICYYIRDNGVGFDMKYAEKLFGVFQRLHRSEEFEGTGLGLALVNRIINKHKGKTWAESKLDQGATIYFTLPHVKSLTAGNQ